MLMEKLPNCAPLYIDKSEYKSFLKKCRSTFYKFLTKPIDQTGTLSDFTVIRDLARGGFGRVVLVQHKNTGTYHAMKTLSKEHIVKTDQVKYIQNEKILLHCLNFPFLIHMDYYFMDYSFVYFVLPFIAGGSIFVHLRKAKRFDENLVRFIGAQVVLGIEYLQFLDVIHRDLKPENILIGRTGYVKITDFGFAKIVRTRTYSICGTPEYMAPEILKGKGYGKATDWWSLGILLYELAAGYSPFYHKDRLEVHESAASLKYSMPVYFSSELQNLIQNILQTDLSKRLGNLQNGADDIKEHKWFRPINWPCLLNEEMTSPFIPEVSSVLQIEKAAEVIVFKIDVENRFEKEFLDF